MNPQISHYAATGHVEGLAWTAREWRRNHPAGVTRRRTFIQRKNATTAVEGWS